MIDFAAVADRLDADANRYTAPGNLAVAIEPRTIQTPALQLLDDALVEAADRIAPRLIWTMGPQEGKSQRVSRWFPTWLLMRDPSLRVGVVSYADGLARRWGRQVRNDITGHPELGLRIRRDTAAANEWQLVGYDGGMITAGIGGGLTGRPLDVLLIDDPLAGREEADSDTYRQRCKDWWTSTGSPRLAEDAIVVIIMTRWHEDDLAGWLLHEDPTGWRHVNIPAQADHNPDQGQVDILGRQPGEYMASARGRTVAGWERRKTDAGSRDWNALYQGRPSPAEGGIFKRGWWRLWATDYAVQHDDGTWDAPGCERLIISVDATFKDSKASDFVVMQVWGKRGPQAILLDQVRARMDFPTTCDTLVKLCAKWPRTSEKVIEDKANGPAILAQLRTRVSGLVAFTPKDSKEARANAVVAFVEAGNVEIPDPTKHPWVGGFVEECAGFPTAAHDDQVDTCTQALHRLLLGPRPGIRWM